MIDRILFDNVFNSVRHDSDLDGGWTLKAEFREMLERYIREAGLRKKTDRIDMFHDHLDHCARCREHPFDLCQLGNKLLWSVVDGADEILGELK